MTARSSSYLCRRPGTVGLLALLVVGCGYTQPDDVAGVGDSLPPVASTEPSPFAAEVAVDSPIRVRFAKAVRTESLSMVVEAAGLPVEGTPTFLDRYTVEFVPTQPLFKGMPYTVTLTNSAAPASRSPTEQYSYDFTTVTTACVKPGGADGCFALISTAVAAAEAGDSIAVAAGTYDENVILTRTVNLLGGYNSSLTERNPAANPTKVTGQDSTLALVEILSATLPDLNETLLDGFVLVDHYHSDDHGGGIRVVKSNVRIRNNIISRNTAYFLGGGVYVMGGIVHIAKNRIENNRLIDGGDGAGVGLETANVELLDNQVIGNQIPATSENGRGGGVSILLGQAVLIGNRIEGNVAAVGPYAGFGNGVSIDSAKVKIVGGAISRNDTANPTSRSTADLGAGLFIGNSEVSVEGVMIEDNVASDAPASGGSAIHANMSKVALSSSIVAGNRYGSAGISFGPTGSYSIVNCTISGNAGSGSAGTGVRSQAPFMIINSLLQKQAIGFEAVTGTEAVTGGIVRNNVFFQNVTDAMGFTPGVSNLKVDPKLGEKFHLTAESPLVDSGSAAPAIWPRGDVVPPPVHDIDGDARVIAGTSGSVALPDIGADEYRP